MGNAQASFTDSKKFQDFLVHTPGLYRSVASALHQSNLDFNDLKRGELKVGEDGTAVLSFVDRYGGRGEVVIGEEEHMGTYRYGNTESRFHNGNLVGANLGSLRLSLSKNWQERLSEGVEEQLKVAQSIKDGKGIANADTETYKVGFQNAYEIASGKGKSSEFERRLILTEIGSTP